MYISTVNDFMLLYVYTYGQHNHRTIETRELKHDMDDYVVKTVQRYMLLQIYMLLFPGI